MKFKRIEGVTTGRNPHHYVEFKGEKIAFLAQETTIPLAGISFPKVPKSDSPRISAWYVYRLELKNGSELKDDGSVKIVNDNPLGKKDAVDMAEQYAINE